MIDQARMLYIQGEKPKQIAQRLGVALGTVYNWSSNNNWGDNISSLEIKQKRLALLITKENKTTSDYHEIDKLDKLINPKVNITKRPKTNKKNNIENIHPKHFDEFYNSLFNYQKKWYDARNNRFRIILKSRQIGATYYFAFEALKKAVLDGRNQIFLSASKDQSFIFKEYIKQFARAYLNIELQGYDRIILSNGAILYFLATNSATAQGYHGDVYIDEFFWIPKFDELHKLASAMALHKQWTKTYFSTPSNKSHPAYSVWFNKDLNVFKSDLTKGKLYDDGKWRQVVTINDAVRQGCNLFDIQEIKKEYSKKDFEQLLECKFHSNSTKVFILNDLKNMEVSHIKHNVNDAVYIGFDPAVRADISAVTIVSKPLGDDGKFKLVEFETFQNVTYSEQAQYIRQCCDNYNVAGIVIDTTMNGYGVYEMVMDFYPTAIGVNSNLETKTRIITRTMEIVKKNKLIVASENIQPIIKSFMQLEYVTTKTGLTTFRATRNNESGHADLAFAIMYAIYNEPFRGDQGFYCSLLDDE